MSKLHVELAQNEVGQNDGALADAEVMAGHATLTFRDAHGRDHTRDYHFFGSVDDVSFKVAKSKQKVEDEDPNVTGVSKGWGPRPLLPDTSHASAELKPDPYVEKKPAGVADSGDKSKAEQKKVTAAAAAGSEAGDVSKSHSGDSKKS